MAKLQSSFKNMVLALLGVALVASAGLGLVNEVTKTPIEVSSKKAQEQAIANVLPAFDHLGEMTEQTLTGFSDPFEIYPALSADDKIIGHAVKTYTNSGFSGYISIMVGFDAKNNVSGFKVLKHQETPGLGSKMDTWFSDKEEKKTYIIPAMAEWFKSAKNPKQIIVGKNPGETKFEVSKKGGDIDAITAATISSSAFLKAINTAYLVVSNNDKSDGYSSATTQN